MKVFENKTTFEKKAEFTQDVTSAQSIHVTESTLDTVFYGNQDRSSIAEKSTVVGKDADAPDEDSGGNTLTAQSIFGYNAGAGNEGTRADAFGSYAANGNSGDNLLAVGRATGRDNSGDDVTAIGDQAGRANTGGLGVFVGLYAGNNSAGPRNVFVGYQAGQDNTQGDNIGIGRRALNGNTGEGVIAMGNKAGENNSEDNVFIVQARSETEIFKGYLADKTDENEADFELLSDGAGLIVNSSDGSERRRITIDNSGNVVAEAV